MSHQNHVINFPKKDGFCIDFVGFRTSKHLKMHKFCALFGFSLSYIPFNTEIDTLRLRHKPTLSVCKPLHFSVMLCETQVFLLKLLVENVLNMSIHSDDSLYSSQSFDNKISFDKVRSEERNKIIKTRKIKKKKKKLTEIS